MKVKFFEAVRSTVSQVVETANRVSVEEQTRLLRKTIYRLERSFQAAVAEQNLNECKELRNKINVAKKALQAL